MTKETTICKIHKENNIVHLQFNESAILKHTDVSEIYEYINEVYGKVKYSRLIDIRSNMIIDESAKDFIKNQTIKHEVAAQAILAGKNTTEEIFNAFIGPGNEKTPIRVFTDYESAVKWLHSSRV
jgi:hypothetical protein